MKGYNTVYFLKEGVKSIFQRGFMSFAAVTVIIACLLISGSFALVAYNVNELIAEAEQQNELLAFVDETLSDTEALGLAGSIYAVSNVKSAEFVSADQAFVDYSEELGDDADLLEGLDGDALRHRYRILVNDLEQTEQTAEELEQIQGIAKVRYSYELADGIVTMRNIVNVITWLIGALLLVVSVFMISNTVKLATFDRREEIAIMKMVGATNMFIRWPFIVQGFLLGMMGGLVAFFAQWGIYTYAGKIILQYAPVFELIPFGSIAITMLVAFLVVGFIVGVLGGVTTIRRFMRV